MLPITPPFSFTKIDLQLVVPKSAPSISCCVIISTYIRVLGKMQPNLNFFGENKARHDAGRYRISSELEPSLFIVESGKVRFLIVDVFDD